MRSRRIRRHSAELDVTAFINLIVVLVPFLLSTAVFTRLSVIDLALPAQSSGVEQLKVDELKLEVVIRPDALEVGDKIGGLIQRIPNNAQGYDTVALAQLIEMLKQRFPTQANATVLALPDTSYEVLVQVMDAVRERPVPASGKGQPVPLFPDISIGDAPLVKKT
ncbi:MAG: biopolymer transporter ExbD [Aquincola sp.]|nr:biopolymer transporter ExbD [Aquincola sp.]MDH4287792.1 biopolymer transporter ExbD [Aquincola sp.]MDH5331443.1 biopolymer transporter ExbD [Aquincola sp.]